MVSRTCLALAALVVASSLPAFAQAPASRDYLSQLTNARPSALPDGRIVVSMDATAGDLRGLLTLTLTDGAEGLKGAWVFSATYLQDLRPDGTPIDPADHVAHDHDDPATPALHREYASIRRDGAITGSITSASLSWTPDGQLAGVSAAELVITGGSRNFKSAAGSGRVGTWASLPGALTLHLSF